jgi:hypothetical protein
MIITKNITMFTFMLVMASGLTWGTETEEFQDSFQLDLTLYSLLGTSVLEIDPINQNALFNKVPDNLGTFNIGAGFFLQVGDHFAYGADYLYGFYTVDGSEGLQEVRVFESPFFVQYKVLKMGLFSLAPQIGFTFGSMEIQSYDLNSTIAAVATAQYFTGRIGVSLNFDIKNGLYLGVKGGYNFPFSGEETWKYRGSEIDTIALFKPTQFHINLLIGTRTSING